MWLACIFVLCSVRPRDCLVFGDFNLDFFKDGQNCDDCQYVTTTTLLCALVVSKVDCCSTVLAGISGSLLDWLQSVLDKSLWRLLVASRATHWHGACRIMMMMMMSQCWMLMLSYYSQLGGQITWLCFSVTFIGWKSWKESSSVSLFWRTTVYMAPCRRILPTNIRHVHTSSSWSAVVPTGTTQRLSVSCGCHTRLKHSSIFDKSCSVTYNILAPPQNRTI